ncbi:MAG: hypothetical protein Q4C76_01700 [Bacillota bacterium]|nr:hypothetical protein [Bacillota bacterium]
MDQKNRTILVIAIAITVLAAVFVSFGLPSLMGVPEVTLPDLSQEGAGETGGVLPVEVTTDTVQTVIATLDRPDSYYRELTVTLFWNGGSSSNQVQIWADGGYVKTAVTTAGTTQHRLVGDGTLYLWYAGDRTWKETKLGDSAADLAQRIPTYEDVLELDPEQINAAGYERKNDRDCIYVEVRDDELNSLDRYWIETATGLLCGAETQENGRTVYEMTAAALRTPLEDGVSFALPDGTVLHESVAVQKEDGGQS